MEGILAYLKRAVEENCSDLFIVAGKAVSVLKGGGLMPLEEEKLTPEDSERLVRDLYRIAARPYRRYLDEKDDDFSLSITGLARFRVNAYRQRGSRAAVIRVVRFGIPDWKLLNIPGEVMEVADLTCGLVLVTGPAGSGRSTTLACIVDAINSTRSAHIITIEDPIEFLHQNKKGIVSQRELDIDADSGLAALHASLRQSPHVIMVGDMRDPDAIRTVLDAAESGRLVLSTLYTTGAASTISRVINSFPAAQQQQVRVQLAQTLQAVVTQQLLPAADGGLVPAFEVVRLNSTVRDMILEGRMEQIDMAARNLPSGGTVGMDDSLFRLYQSGRISEETALRAAVEPDHLKKKIRMYMR